MGKRLASGFIMGFAVLFGIIYLPAWVVKIVVVLLVGVSARECARMVMPKHPTSSMWLPVILAMAFSAIIQFLHSQDSFFMLGLGLIIILTFLYYLFLPHSLDVVLSQMARTLFIVLYLGVLMSFMGLTLDLAQGWAWLILVLAATFAADTGAYFAGKNLGKRLLAPRISPAKTMEGFLGGIASSIAAAFIVKYLFLKNISTLDLMAVGVLIGLVGPLGDLAESLIKRSVGVKDSGKLIPGHGGLLDRIDAALFTSPVIYWYALFTH
ncbi:MAG: phosphatidate cytidylyltransferase [bacterium]|nr:phosphatidate cytidylyltransferase [bacterium]